tara:strand:- start:462 stop:812 length:351 start_codon:yes stop_codon:yes gene_type:complete
MFYIKLEENDENSIIYYCKNCGNTNKSLINTNVCISKENFNKSNLSSNNLINNYTVLDNTLPRTNTIKCPNHECLSNTTDFDNEKREIIYIRYDDNNMNYIYLCSHCQTNWKTDKI